MWGSRQQPRDHLRPELVRRFSIPAGKPLSKQQQEAAASEGGKTISMTLGGRVLQKAAAPLPERTSTWVWNWGSKHFAEGASGNLRVFLREPIRNNSTWNTVEYPILRVNPFVRTVPR